MQNSYLDKLRNHEKLNLKEQIMMVITLSIPSILAQISSVVMQYIDAAMIGQLGANESAGIGLVSSSTWLLTGLCSAASIGFSVQVAHRIGAKQESEARKVVFQGFICTLLWSCLLMIVALLLSKPLPIWLGGEAIVCDKASKYFFIFALSLPFYQLNYLASSLLQCSGNMKTPGILNVVMCILDVVFNFLLIYPTRDIALGNYSFTIYGANLGISGASLGTALSVVVVALILSYLVIFKSDVLHLRHNEKYSLVISDLKEAIKIASPVAFEQVVLCGAYIMATSIVAPLGTIAIAAHSFAVTAESLCYMPGYGVGNAATTIIGQSIGAKRKDLTKRLGYLVTMIGVVMMSISALLLYFAAPLMMSLLTKDPQIQALGSAMLRIVVFVEPFYAINIVASGVFRGASDTLVPSCLNLISMWLVRIPLSAYLAPRLGLKGVWIAMSIELFVRGMLFLIRLTSKKAKWTQQAT